MRSLYKVPYVHKSMFNYYINRRKDLKVHDKIANILKKNKVKLVNNLIFWNKSTKVNKNEVLLDKRIGVHNGKIFMYVIVNNNATGFRLGQFVITKKIPIHSKKYRRKSVKVRGFDHSTSKNYNLTLKKYLKEKKIKKWA